MATVGRGTEAFKDQVRLAQLREDARGMVAPVCGG